MASIGRNDPCPCGSGEKYKKCCIAKSGAVAADPNDARARAGGLEQVLRFARRPEFDNDHVIARLLFWTERVRAMEPERAEALLAEDDSQSKYNSWFVFDLDVDDCTVVEMFLARRGSQLSAQERAFLERTQRAHLALYEVQRVEPGHGVDVLDVWSGTRTFVVERAASRDLVQWDLLAARVVPGSDGVARFEGGIYLYPAAAKEPIVRELKRYHRQFQKNFPGADDAAFFRQHGMVFHHLWLDHVILRPLPRLVTAEGDEMMFATAVFDLLDEAAVHAAFTGRDELHEQDDGSFVLLEDAGAFQRSLGTFIIDSHRVRLETTSKARAESGRAWLERLAGGAVRYRATSLESVAQATQRHRDAPPSPDSSDLPPALEAQVLTEFYDRHYREWLDQSIPALKNKTPREAAASRSLRPRLIDLLKQMDNSAERARGAGHHAYDSHWLWEALGLKRPTSEPLNPRTEP